MPLNKMNMFWKQQTMSRQNQFFQSPATQEQFGGVNYSRMWGQSPQRFPFTQRRQSESPIPSGLVRSINGHGGGLGGGMPGWNPGWEAGPQNAGGQGYATPGYPPQGFGQQQPAMKPMPNAQNYPLQGFPTQGNTSQGYLPQVYNKGYGGQMPVQPAWEEPKKGGIKGFISNLMAKRKR